MKNKAGHSFAEATQEPCQIDTVIIPVAGKGTRNLPATKGVPKHLLMVNGQPLAQYAVEEAKLAGVKKFVFIIDDNPVDRELTKKHFLPNESLEEHLLAKGMTDMLEEIRSFELRPDQISFVVQTKQTGLWDAIKSARDEIVGENFGVILPDDVILPAEAGLLDLAKHHQPGGITISVEKVAQADATRYGIVACGPVSADGTFAAVNGVVEKPKLEDVPLIPGTKFAMANFGRYILPVKLFDLYTPATESTVKKEISVADAIGAVAHTDEVPVRAVLVSGKIHDCGTRASIEKTNFALCIADPEIGPAFRQYAEELLAATKAPRKGLHLVTTANNLRKRAVSLVAGAGH